MNQVNEQFQALLKEKNFPMKVSEGSDGMTYQGKLAVTEGHLVDFAVFLSKGEDETIGQIVFNNVAYMDKESDKSLWLEAINQLNLDQGLYYYFALDHDNRVFARYVTKITSDVENLFQILIKGSRVVRQAVPYLDAHTSPRNAQ